VLAWKVHGSQAVDFYFHLAFVVCYGLYGYRYIAHKYPKLKEERLVETQGDVSYGDAITEPLLQHQRNQAEQRAFSRSFWCVVIADFSVEMARQMWVLMANFIIVHISSSTPDSSPRFSQMYVAVGALVRILVVDVLGAEVKRFADRRT
jgi:hypothetical protein